MSRIISGPFCHGDVCFIEETNNALHLAFTKNNVFVRIKAPSPIASEIAIRIIENIVQAPALKEMPERPQFLIAR